jgi:two-component system, LytTR family, response regulator
MNPKAIRTLIVDDELGAVKTLRGMLGEYCPQVHVLDEVLNATEALKAVEKHRPDLVFLDIEMPHGSGFDFLRQFQRVPFGVIFTTAYTEHAVEAINRVQPWAYLVKPISVRELKEAVRVAEEKMAQPKVVENETADNGSMVFSDSRKGGLVVRHHEMLLFEAQGAVTTLHYLRDGKVHKHTMYRSLNNLMTQLPASFCRTHHRSIVNMNRILRFERTGRNGVVHLHHGLKAVVSIGKMGFPGLDFNAIGGLGKIGLDFDWIGFFGLRDASNNLRQSNPNKIQSSPIPQSN